MELEETVAKLNQFRKNPQGFEKDFLNYGKALRRVKKNAVASEIENCAKGLNKIKDLPELVFSQSLTKACEEKLTKFIEEKENVSVYHLSQDQIKDSVGKYCEGFTKLSCTIDEGSVEDLICRIFISSFDKQRKNRASLVSKDFKFVGVAKQIVNNDTFRIIILADSATPIKHEEFENISTKHETEENGEYNSSKWVDSLKEIFDDFDILKTGYIDPLLLKEGLKSADLDSKNPSLFKFICEMDSPVYSSDKGINFQSFISFFDTKLNHDFTKTGLERAFNLFVSDPYKDFIDEASIKKICDKIGISLGENEAKEILMRASISGNHLTFQEFYSIMSEAKEYE